MLAAILLIGFTMSKINERRILYEKIASGGRMIQDFQVIIDYIALSRKEFSLTHPAVKKEIQDFILVYTKERMFYDLIIADQELKIVASMRPERLDRSLPNDLLAQSIRSGQFNTQVEKSGGLLSARYKTLILYSPLWFRGRVAGGIQMEVPIGDVMRHLLISEDDFDLHHARRHCFDHLWKFLTVSSLGDPLKRACSTHTKNQRGRLQSKDRSPVQK
jgi:hypothetical protein